MLKKKVTKKSVKCVSVWIDENIINEYQLKYPRTFSKMVQFYTKKALENESIVKNAIFNNSGDSNNNIFGV